MTVADVPVSMPSVVISDKMYAARLHAVRARPYMASALYALRLVESPRVPTMSVDRHWRCYLSPTFVASRPEEEIAALLVHEVSHLLRDHAGRSDRYAVDHDSDGPSERLRMNIAADFEINDDVYGAGLVTPDDAIHPSALDLDAGLLMEDYLRWFSLGPRTDAMTWLECGSGADGRGRDDGGTRLTGATVLGGKAEGDHGDQESDQGHPLAHASPAQPDRPEAPDLLLFLNRRN